MLAFSLPNFARLQNRFGGGLQTACPVGMLKAMALVLLAVNACLHSSEWPLKVGSVSGIASSLASEPFRFAFSCLQWISSLVCLI